MKTVRKITILILGFVFFTAGILKLMDPVGAGLVVGEYLKFLHLNFLAFLSMPTGVAFALAETVLGAMMLTGVWKKICANLSALLLALFTVLTFILCLFNPPMDCGCFGEAIHLTHAQSLLKNILLCGLWCASFLPFSALEEPKKIKKVSFLLSVIAVVGFSIYSIFSIPLVDFTPYEPGVELAKGEDADLDKPTKMFVYERDGQQGAFFEGFLPDSTWTFVREETYVRNLPLYVEGEEALSFFNAEGDYCDSLAVKGKVVIVSVHTPENLSSSSEKKIADFTARASAAGYTVLRIEAGEPSEGKFCADRRTLMSLNRSNGGATVVIDGEIVGKWAKRNLPSDAVLSSIAERNASESAMDMASSGRLKFQGFLIYAFAVMLLL